MSRPYFQSISTHTDWFFVACRLYGKRHAGLDVFPFRVDSQMVSYMNLCDYTLGYNILQLILMLILK